MKNACVFHVFWLNGFTHRQCTNVFVPPPLPTNSHTQTILHFFLSPVPTWIVPSAISTSYLFLLSSANHAAVMKSSLNSLSYWTGFLRLHLPSSLPTGTGCTVYPRTGTQWREKEGAAGRHCQLAWRAAQPSSASFSAPPAPLPPCSGTWPGKANLSSSEDKAHDMFVFVCACVLIQAYLPTLLPSPLPSVFCCF